MKVAVSVGEQVGEIDIVIDGVKDGVVVCDVVGDGDSVALLVGVWVCEHDRVWVSDGVGVGE